MHNHTFEFWKHQNKKKKKSQKKNTIRILLVPKVTSTTRSLETQQAWIKANRSMTLFYHGPCHGMPSRPNKKLAWLMSLNKMSLEDTLTPKLSIDGEAWYVNRTGIWVMPLSNEKEHTSSINWLTILWNKSCQSNKRNNNSSKSYNEQKNKKITKREIVTVFERLDGQVSLRSKL